MVDREQTRRDVETWIHGFKVSEGWWSRFRRKREGVEDE